MTSEVGKDRGIIGLIGQKKYRQNHPASWKAKSRRCAVGRPAPFPSLGTSWSWALGEASSGARWMGTQNLRNGRATKSRMGVS